MTHRIARPNDPYSKDWALYWEQNPHMLRGIGADAAPPPAATTPPPADQDVMTPDQIKSLKADAALAKTLREENELFKQKHQEAEKHRKEQERIAKENGLKAAKASGDIDTLEKSWGEKYAARETELQSELATHRSMIEELTVGSTASDICNKIAMEGCAPALLPHVRGRLKSEIKDGKPVTRVLDAHGNVSALTIDDLMKELKAVPYLASLIVGSKAGGAGQPGAAATTGGGKLKTQEQVRAMPPMEQAAYFKSVQDSPKKYAD
jgi:hypothetical protein